MLKVDYIAQIFRFLGLSINGVVIVLGRYIFANSIDRQNTQNDLFEIYIYKR